MNRFLSFSFLLLLVLAMSAVADAQSCATATCNAASPAEADVLAALPSSSNTNATVVVNIPAGNSSWTTTLNYKVPTAVTNLTIQGTTTISWSGTAGTSSYAYTVADNTIIQDAVPSNTSLLTISTGGSSTYFRVTGLTIEGGSVGASSNSKYNGILDVGGSSQNVRIDHNHFNNNTYAPATQSTMAQVDGTVEGVFDHNVLDLGNNTNTANGFHMFTDLNDNTGYGDGSWASPTAWGSTEFFFMESNYVTGGAPNDCADAGRFVMRYNTLDSNFVAVQSHGTKSTAGGWRGCRAYEVYHNYFTGPSASPASGSVGSKGNAQLIWGNTSSRNAAYRFYESSVDRQNGNTTETATPNGWGYCGTAANGNGVGSGWDGNQPASTGYPCLDGLGRGQTAQAMNGQYWPNRLNSVTGTIAWPQQYLEPIYMWNNSIGAAQYVLIQDTVTQNNQDYYYDCGSASGNTSCSGGFTGTAGTGYGPLASRPTTCSPGPGGTYFTSPTGSYGVGYFATDANNGQGELYVCSSTNTWTPIYEPYTYPHPLVTGNSAAASNGPSPPTNLAGTVIN